MGHLALQWTRTTMSTDSDTFVKEKGQWSPSEGDALRRLRTHLIDTGFLKSSKDFAPVGQSALRITSRCASFQGPDDVRTGLVVGYVQSGKTLSMASVASAAADNGCRLVIVLAGTKRNLLTQSAGRFKKDLRSNGKFPDAWMMMDSTESLDSATNRKRFYDCLQEWKEDFVDEEDKSPIFWTVMKHHAHLDALRSILAEHDLRGIPALIIDDEADQAGLNTTPDEEEDSTTFTAIRELRACLPHHSYLQYTATPQAPLLISLADLLSPDFAEVLEPGKGYTGGTTFFADNSPYVRMIPQDDLFAPGDPPESPPESLVEALKYFFVGTALDYIGDKSTKRSMLIHPSRLTDDHGTFVMFVEHLMAQWLQLLRLSPTDPDRVEFVDELRKTYTDLTARVLEAPPFDEALLKKMSLLLGRRSLAQEVNAKAEEVDWTTATAHILVGGEKLNRGYTVENLSVTWMPRDAGGWNADTLQQRARFFGYKKSYLENCRVFLHPDVMAAFHGYVEHEQDIRRQLKEHEGRPLNEWKRAFFMDRRSRPTRANVLTDPYFRSTEGEWWRQSRPHGAEAAGNLPPAQRLQALEGFEPHPAFPQHLLSHVPLEAVRDVLVDWSVSGHADVVAFFAIRCWLSDILENDPDAQCQLLQIRGKGGAARTRKRDKRDTIKLFEGKRASGKGYPGDGKIHAPSGVTVQLHMLQIDGDTVPAIAIRVPDSLRTSSIIVQPASA
jgi:hypothetical protein